MTTARDRLGEEIVRLCAAERIAAREALARLRGSSVYAGANEESRREVLAILRETGGDLHGEDATRKVEALVAEEIASGRAGSYAEAFRRVRDRAPDLVDVARGGAPADSAPTTRGDASARFDAEVRALVAGGAADYRTALLTARDRNPSLYVAAMKERDARTVVETDE